MTLFRYHHLGLRFIMLFLMGMQLMLMDAVAQSQSVTIQVKEKEAQGGKLRMATAEVRNSGTVDFEGYIKVDANGTFRTLSEDNIPIRVLAGKTKFIPIQLYPTKMASAGEHPILYQLIDAKTDRVTAQTETSVKITEVMNLRVWTVAPVIQVTNPMDSVKIPIVVTNGGNTERQFSLVFTLPAYMGGQHIFELKGKVKARQDTSYTFAFMLNKQLLDQTQFQVQVAALAEGDKQLLSNTRVSVELVKSARSYTDLFVNDRYYNFGQQNSLSLSMRMLGEHNYAYQLIGAHAFNLPAGSMAVRGNVYKSNLQSELYSSGTAIQYNYRNMQVEAGSITEMYEVSTYGRGVKGKWTDDSGNHTWSVGVVDNEFNLFSATPLFKNGYTVFAEGRIGANNSQRGAALQYIFKDDPFEAAKHHIAGTSYKAFMGRHIRYDAKLWGGASRYDNRNALQPSVALEVSGQGDWEKWKWNGNYFYSSPYFPGNRRGMIAVNQQLYRKINAQRSWWTNFYINHYKPKSHVLELDMVNTQMQGQVAGQLPNMGAISTTVGVIGQLEKTNMLYNVENPSIPLDATLKSLRALEEFTIWSANRHHSASLLLENGLVYYPNAEKPKFQGKAAASYRFKSLSVQGSYQYGAYYLSEYSNAQLQHINFRRVQINANYYKSFFDERLSTNLGINYYKDFGFNTAPSGYANVNYKAFKKLEIYANTSVYQYSFMGYSGRVIKQAELGVRINFKNKAISPDKKGKLILQYFYDDNGNGRKDEGEKFASGVLASVNDIVFISDNNGQVIFSAMPYGEYNLDGGTLKEWFFDAQKTVVNQRKNMRMIPMQQSGSVTGKVAYSYNGSIAKDIQLKYAGITAIIQKEDFKRNVVTDNFGNFSYFLPTGVYTITLHVSSLPEDVICSNPKLEFTVASGKITTLPAFNLEVKSKKMNIKRFD